MIVLQFLVCWNLRPLHNFSFDEIHRNTADGFVFVVAVTSNYVVVSPENENAFTVVLLQPEVQFPPFFYSI